MGAFRNLTGEVFNGIKVLSLSSRRGNSGQYYYNCICHCGKPFITTGNSLVSGHTRSCGCSHCVTRPGTAGPHTAMDLIGTVYGYLTVVDYSGYDYSRKRHLWKCLCKCGRYVTVSTGDLRRGHKKSCCQCDYAQKRINELRKFKTLDEYKLRNILNAMKMRCYNPNNPEYHRYGGRGIKICDEWMGDTRVFVDWALTHGYKRGLTIERIDNDKGYSPDNCDWKDRFAQMNNTSKNYWLKISDSLSLTRAQCARLIDVSYDKSRTFSDNELIRRVKHCLAANESTLVKAMRPLG